MRVLAQSVPQLAELRDIHEPGGVDWWPPGPAFWVLIALLLIAIVTGIAWAYRRGRMRRAATRMLREAIDAWHTHHDDHRLLAELSAWLRRVAMARFGRHRVASMVNEQWQQLLNTPMTDHPFSQQPGQLLIDGPYRRSLPALDQDAVTQLRVLCESWLRAVDRRAVPGQVA